MDEGPQRVVSRGDINVMRAERAAIGKERQDCSKAKAAREALTKA
jgi:hypothetical protein